MGEQDLILDGGPCDIGVESTIIDCTQSVPRILRPGSVTQEMIEEVTALSSSLPGAASEIRASGSLASHYAPAAKVHIDVDPQIGDGYLAMAEFETPAGVIRLASPTSVEDFARVLYKSFREADTQDLRRIVVQQPEGTGLAEAIRDRLRKAAK
jgi:L-threonylcarbamoyladenylate synthase